MSDSLKIDETGVSQDSKNLALLNWIGTIFFWFYSRAGAVSD